MNPGEVLRIIKSHGYWQVRFLPEEYKEDLIEPALCLDIIKQSSISLRGWDYPHIPRQKDEKQDIYLAGDHAEGWIAWDLFREFWRFYRSGQFVHLFGIFDDWYAEEGDAFGRDSRWKNIKPGDQLDIIDVLFRMTEVMQFAKNICNSGVIPGAVNVEISLHGLSNRRLVVMDQRRVPLFPDYICRMPDLKLPRVSFTPDDKEEKYNETALNLTRNVCEQFQWFKIPTESFKEDQKKLLERRL